MVCYLQRDDIKFAGGWLCRLFVAKTLLRIQEAGSKGGIAESARTREPGGH